MADEKKILVHKPRVAGATESMTILPSEAHVMQWLEDSGLVGAPVHIYELEEPRLMKLVKKMELEYLGPVEGETTDGD